MKGLSGYEAVHLGALRKEDKRYWRIKELYFMLPYELCKTIEKEFHAKRSTKSWTETVEQFLKKLSKLEQLIYTNEIQGE